MCKREASKIYELHIWAFYQINEETKRQKYDILFRQIGELEENAFLGWEELFCKNLKFIQLLGSSAIYLSWPKSNNYLTHGCRTCIKRDLIHYGNFLIFVHKNVYRIGFQNIKIGPLKGFEKKAFFSLLLMRKRLSGGQKWFLKPYFPLIRDMFVFRSGPKFLFWALEVPKLRVGKRSENDFDLLESNSIYIFVHEN